MDIKSLSFVIETKIGGVVVAVKMEKEKAENAGAALQFMRLDEVKGVDKIEVKVLGTRKDDLLKFVNKKVEISNVKISKIDYNTYYSTHDITNVKILN